MDNDLSLRETLLALVVVGLVVGLGKLLASNEKLSWRLTPHTFRHTFASRLLQAGVSLSKVSKLLGHANEATTQIYAHLCPEATGSEAAAVLNRLHAIKPPQGDNPIALPPQTTPSVFSYGSAGATEQLTLSTRVNDTQVVDFQEESDEAGGRP